MNVNQASFHMLLGRGDWGRCKVPTGPVERTAVETFWPKADGEKAATIDPRAPLWDPRTGELTLAPGDEMLLPTEGETAFEPPQRRACASDAAGNLYLVSDDGLAIRCIAACDRTDQLFWPDPRAVPQQPAGPFTDAAPVVDAPHRYVALAVTANGYLVAWWQGPDGQGAERFDLVAGGAPERFRPAEGLPGQVADLAARGPGGLWALLEGGGGLVALDAELRPCASAAPAFAVDPFQPDDPEVPRRQHPQPWQGNALALPGGLTARQLLLGWNEVPLVLAAKPNGIVVVLAVDLAAATFQAPINAGQAWHMAASAPANGAHQSVFLVDPVGNQARELLLHRDPAGAVTSLGLQTTTYPLRRCGGRALGLLAGRVCYDSGPEPRFVPIIERVHRAFATSCTFETQIYDSRTAQCQWDRIRIDACIPAGTAVTIEARVGEEKADLLASGEPGWVRQPAPYLNGDKGELPGKRAIAQLGTDPAHRKGCWDLLLQGQRGRYCQLRITLSGDGRTTPRLRALRLWYPRFSYSERFLPALYREDPTGADLIERFLANIEGINTGIEDRIAAAQAWLDPRTVPEGFLDWLSSWLDLMLDPAWNADRKRLFLGNAVRFFGWRGTVPGLELALRVAFEAELDADAFALGGPRCTCPGQVRVVENFMTRLPARRFERTAAQTGPATGQRPAQWSPAEGSQGLWHRYADAGGAAGTGPFPLWPPAGAQDAAWSATAAAAFGFIPAAGADERAAWQAQLAAESLPAAELPRDQVPAGTLGTAWAQFVVLPRFARQRWHDFLQRRYARVERLNQAWLSGWNSLGEIPIPAELPVSGTALADWLAFEGEVLPRSRSAHRFSVLLPLRTVSEGGPVLADRMAFARRIIEVEKPAHSEFDVRFYWAMNRVGEARLGQDSELGAGSRAPELIPPALIGTSYIGSSFVAGSQGPLAGRARLAC